MKGCKMIKIITIQGYKSFELGIFKNEDPAKTYIKKAIEKEVLALLDEGLEWVLISGQLGVEIWAAEVIFELKKEYSELKLGILTPFLHQESNWNEENQQMYQTIIAKADFVEAISKQPYVGPWQFRNKNAFFLHKTDGAIILYDPEKEGSPKFFYEAARAFQEENEYFLRIIDFYDLQAIVDEDNF